MSQHLIKILKDIVIKFTIKKHNKTILETILWRYFNPNSLKGYLQSDSPHIFTYVVLVGLQGPLQCDRQLLVDLVNSCLDFHLDAPLSCFDTILPTVRHRITGLKPNSDDSELKEQLIPVQ